MNILNESNKIQPMENAALIEKEIETANTFIEITKEWNIERIYRDLSIAYYMGWYEKPDAHGIWYATNEYTGKEEMVYNQFEEPDGHLPFFYDGSRLLKVLDVLREKLEFTLGTAHMEDDKWYYVVFDMDLNDFRCELVILVDGCLKTETVRVSVGQRNAQDYIKALYLFVSNIIFTVTKKLR